MTPKIIVNALKCNTCKRVLLSIHRHDFRQCECGTFVDGGQDYIRRGWNDSTTVTDLSIVLDNGQLRQWGDIMEEKHEPTRGERREEKQKRERYGMVKHLEPNVRPMKMPKPEIRKK